MRQVREILRLSLDARLSTRSAAELVGTSATTVRDTVKRFRQSGLSWPLPSEISDTELEERLYGVCGVKPGRRRLSEPDWSVVARELKRKHVTLQVLWEEYNAHAQDGYRYSRFCDLFRRWEGRLPLVMRQSHAGGERLFLDYAGVTVPVVINRRTGEVRGAHIFVAVMGGSSLSFALATWTEQFPDWIEGNNAALAFFGGVPQLLVPDNAKVAVIKACHFDPQINRSYTDMARHYGTAVLPARPRKPRDKAKVASLRRDCRALAAGQVAQPDLLQSCRGQRRDRRVHGRSQRPASAAPVCQNASSAVRRGRCAKPEAFAGRALGAC